MCSRRNLFLSCLPFLLLPTISWAESLPDWTQQIRTDHPRLFFNADTWPQVRERALGAENDWYLAIKAHVDRQLKKLENTAQPKPQELGPEAAQAAFVFLVTDDDRYRQLALKCLDASLAYYELCFEEKRAVDWYSTSRVHVTMAWDWLYNHIPPKQRQQRMSRLVRAIDNVLTAKPPIYRENITGYKTGFYGVKNCCWFIGCTALGTGIETELVNRWLVWGHDENIKLLAFRKQACGDDGGGASPTLGYVFGAYPWSPQNFFYTWLSATGENIAPQWPHGAWLANYVIWNRISDEPFPLQFGYGDTSHVTNRLQDNQLYTHMANIRHLYGRANPVAAALARYLQGTVAKQSYTSNWFIYPFLLSRLEESPQPFAPDNLPHARHFDAMGQIFMRSGTTPDDTYCLFTCGGILAQHRHFDALNFVIYHRGFLALDSGTRHSQFENGQHLANYYAQTVAHNCVVIHQPDEPLADYWGGTVEGNHGGQHKQLGSVVNAFETNQDFVYSAGDATACYQHGPAKRADGTDLPEKCSLATRQIVFLLPNRFVIFDRVTSTNTEYRKDWLLHTAHRPVINGHTISADHGKGRIFCRTLLPTDARLTAVGGPGKEFLAAGKSWDIVKGKLKPENLAMMGQWRVEVTPQTARTEDVFLHVIQVGEQDIESMDEMTLIQDASSAGVRLLADGDTWEITFSTQGDLAGHVKRTGNKTEIDTNLATTVTPQSGIMADTK